VDHGVDKDAMLMVRRLAKEEALFAGGSTGVNVVASLDVARRVNDPQALVVTVLADTGSVSVEGLQRRMAAGESDSGSGGVSVGALLEARNSGAPPLISVAPTATVRQALNLMSTYNVSQLRCWTSRRRGRGLRAGAHGRALEEPATLDQPVEDVMDGPFPVVDVDLPVERLAPSCRARRRRRWCDARARSPESSPATTCSTSSPGSTDAGRGDHRRRDGGAHVAFAAPPRSWRHCGGAGIRCGPSIR